MSRRVLITGGTGFVGSHTVESYLAAGWDVRAAVRNPKRLTWLANLPAETAQCAFSDQSSLEAAVCDCDVVVHCAAVTKTPRRAEYYRINADAVRNLVIAARNAGARRFVLCSSHAASGPAIDGIASREEDPAQPLSDYGKSKLQGEQELQRHAGNMEWIILRPPSVFGPRDEQFVPLFRAVSRYGIYPVLGGGERQYSYIYVRDLARALLMAGTAEMGANQIYFVAHPEALDWELTANTIAGFAHRRAHPIRIPSFMAYGLGAINDVIAKLTGNAALLSSDKVREMLAAGWICSAEKIHQAWGFMCEYSTEQALRETYDFYRAAKRI